MYEYLPCRCKNPSFTNFTWTCNFHVVHDSYLQEGYCIKNHDLFKTGKTQMFSRISPFPMIGFRRNHITASNFWSIRWNSLCSSIKNAVNIGTTRHWKLENKLPTFVWNSEMSKTAVSFLFLFQRTHCLHWR